MTIYDKNPKPNNINTDLVNERVRFPEVRVIGPNGEQLGVMSAREAQKQANSYELDLYCIAPTATPPVCRILNYSKFRFEQQKKAKEAKNNQHTVEIKEVRLTPVIMQHDIETKAKAARKFLEGGNKLKVSLRFRGRQMAHTDIGLDVINHFIELLLDVANVEKQPYLEGNWYRAQLTPIKK